MRGGSSVRGHNLYGFDVMENRAAQGETPFLLWLDPATGVTVHECPACVTKERALVAVLDEMLG